MVTSPHHAEKAEGKGAKCARRRPRDARHRPGSRSTTNDEKKANPYPKLVGGVASRASGRLLATAGLRPRRRGVFPHSPYFARFRRASISSSSLVMISEASSCTLFVPSQVS